MEANVKLVTNYLNKSCELSNRQIPKARISLVARKIAERFVNLIVNTREIEQGTLFYNDYEAVLLEKDGNLLITLDIWYASIPAGLKLRDTVKNHSIYGNAIYLFKDKRDAISDESATDNEVKRFVCINPNIAIDTHPSYTAEWVNSLRDNKIQTSLAVQQLPVITSTFKNYLADYLNNFITAEALHCIARYDFPNSLIRLPEESFDKAKIIMLDK